MDRSRTSTGTGTGTGTRAGASGRSESGRQLVTHGGPEVAKYGVADTPCDSCMDGSVHALFFL